MPGAVRPVEVSGVAYDSRMVTRGAVFVASKACTPTASRSCAMRRRAARRGHRRRADAPAGVRGCRSTMPGSRWPSLAAAFYADPSHALPADRHHRHERQDDDHILVAAIFEAAGVMCGRIGTVGTASATRPSDADHAGGAGPAATAARDGRSRGRRLRDRSLVPRAGSRRATACVSPPASSPT